MPLPWSVTRTSNHWSTSTTNTTTCDPSGENLTALLNRLMRTCISRFSSPKTVAVVFSALMTTPRSLAKTSTLSTACSTTVFKDVVVRAIVNSPERRSKNFTDPLIRAAIYTFLLVELLVIGFILWGPNARECGSIVDRLKMVNPRDWRCEPIIWIALFLNQLENTGASEETSRNFLRLADACRARGESYRARQACLRSRVPSKPQTCIAFLSRLTSPTVNLF